MQGAATEEVGEEEAITLGMGATLGTGATTGGKAQATSIGIEASQGLLGLL